MAATIIDGKQIAAEMRAELAAQVAELQKRGIVPGLGVILVGDDAPSKTYVTAKEKACAEIGIYSDDNRLPASISQRELTALIERMNADKKIHGILMQLPLPSHIDEDAVLLTIDPAKDVDGFHPVSVGKLSLGHKTYLPCTPHGVVVMLMKSGVKIAGANVVIIGRSNIVGKPLANILMQKSPMGNATVTVCHTRTNNLSDHTRRADIIVAAVGHPNTVTADMVKPGAVVIDVGMNRIPDATKKSGHRLVGDVDFEGVKEVAGMITPVPGGVGPMTITMLLHNTIDAAKLASGCTK